MKIAILGAYQTKFGELWNKGLEDLIFEAGEKTIKDAGITKKQIEIVFVANKLAGNLGNQNHLSALVSQVLGIKKIPVIRVEAACASGGVAVFQACLAIASGQYQTALVIGAEKMTDFGGEEVCAGLMTAADKEEQKSGFSFVGLYALMAKRYLHLYGATEEDLALPAVKNHYHGTLNTKAHFNFPITLKQVLESPLIAKPLRLLECSPVSDGAAAIILANPSWAKKKGIKNGIWISGSSLVVEDLCLAQKNLTEITSSKTAAKKAYWQAGIEPKDISLLEVHDCFSIAEILALEDLGIYKKGEGFLGFRKKEVQLGGKKPVNLSGGLKACGHPVGATGIKQIVEIFDQLKERAGKRQVKKARLGLAHNVGGSGGTAAVHIIQK